MIWRPIIERIALTEKLIKKHRLPTRPTKRDKNPHAKDFRGDSVELDALPARELRKLVTKCIEQHISSADVTALRIAEDSERELLRGWAKRAAKAAP
jgi:hypothetical protein